MDLQFLSRKTYKEKEDPGFLSSLKFRDALIIPEGGAGEPGIRGAGEILSLMNTEPYTHICAAVGTAVTLAGLINSSLPHQKITGISILKGTRNFQPLPLSWIKNQERLERCEIIHDYAFGGYAKKSPALLDFMNEVYERSGIPTDFVYTGKLLYAVADLARTNYFPEGSRILIIHSGGLRGNLSLPRGRLHF
jgi:1-aminocyclopropane-1-carboxylate deaminase